MGSKPKVIVIDDSQYIRLVVAKMLENNDYDVVTASNAYDGLRLIRKHHPDVIVLDFFMPDLSGTEVLSRLRAAGDFTPVIACSASTENQVEWIKNNVDIFVSKPFSTENLIKIIQVVLQREKEKPVPQQELPDILRFTDLELDVQARTAQRIGVRQLELTAKEFDLLTLFMRYPRKVLTRSMILNQVWGFDFEGESNVVDVYVGYLRKKLKAKNKPQLIETVRSVGYVLRDNRREETKE